MAAAEAKLPQPTGSSVSLPSQKDEEELELPPTPVSRLQMLEYVNLREWWSHAQGALFFTCFLWVWFIVLMYTRADVEGLFRVRSALAQHVQRVVAHPSLSRAPLHTPAEAPLQCRCACRTRGSSFPTSPCDKVGTEVLDFTGTLRADLAARLLQSHQGMLGTGADVPPKTWDGILSAEDAWFWVLHGLLPDVWGLRNGLPVERPGLLVHRNLVVGGIRARQMRAKPAESCKVDPDLLSLYPARCRSFDPETEPFGPAAAGSVDHSGGAFAPASEASEGGAVEDGTYYAMFDVEQPLSNALETANFLRQNNWLDEATRSLELQALLLNAEAGAYAILSVKFIFPFHGGVEKYIGVRTFHAVQSEDVFTFEAYYPELVWLALIVWLFLQELLRIGLSIYRGRIREYFTNIWNLVDWFSIALGAAICYFYWVMLSDTARIAYTIVGLPRAPLDDVDIAAYRQSWAGVLDTARDVSELKGYYSICLFWYTTVISLRFLKCCTGQAKLAMIQTSLGHAFLDVLHFSIIFLVLFANFVLGGRVLFGDKLEAWSNYARAASSSVRMLLGSSLFDDMYAVAPMSATIWFWLFILTMVFVVMNLLLVIILDNHLSLRRAIGPTLSIWQDAREAFQDLMWRLEWRKDNFSESEYWTCFVENPYAELQDGLLEVAAVPEETEIKSRRNCLALKLSRKHLEDLSAEGLFAEGHPGATHANSMELREIGPDAQTADHLLEKCGAYVDYLQSIETRSELKQVRFFVKLLRSHRMEVSARCQNIEAGVAEEQEALHDCLERLEVSIYQAMEGFQTLRETGVDSLAPPPPGQTGVMKASGAFEHSGNNFLSIANAAADTTILAKTR